jgi:hypothetical protein
MEEHIVNDTEHPLAVSLQHSREELRRILLPRGPDMHIPPGQFPRSGVMRFLLDPRQRKLGIMLFSALLLLLRGRGIKGGLNWLQLVKPFLGART